MDRKDRRAANAEALRRAPDLDLRPGTILAPVAGTTHLGPEDQVLDIWSVTSISGEAPSRERSLW